MQLIARLRSSVGSLDDPRLRHHRAVATDYLASIPTAPMSGSGYAFGANNFWLLNPGRDLPWVARILDAPDADRTSIAVALYERVVIECRNDAVDRFALPVVINKVRANLPPFDDLDAHLLLQMACRRERHIAEFNELLRLPIAALDQRQRAGALSDDLMADARELLATLDAINTGPPGPVKDGRARLFRVIGATGLDPNVFNAGDTWGVAMREWAKAHTSLNGLDALVVHLSTATGVAPTARWRKAAAEIVNRPGIEDAVKVMVDRSFEAELLEQHFLDASPFRPENGALVRGAYWAAAVGAWPWVTETLGRAGVHWCASGRNDNYARDQTLANSCAALLGEIGTTDAHAALGRMKARVRNRNVTKSIDRALAAAAERAGTSPSELLELAVPTEGLDADGRREIQIGDGAALLQLDDEGDAALTWRAPDGRLTDSPPKALADAHPGDIRAAKEALKELRKALTVERGRVEDLLVETRSWPYPVWEERYLRHPVSRVFARRLIWRFTDGDDPAAAVAGLALDGAPTTVDGTPVPLTDATTVTVWHPINAPVDEISAWRELLLRRQVRQPFKQAFREIYVLTPAEIETRTYSNRFAAHILDYPRARALMGARRWGTNFLGPYDGGFEGTAKHAFPTYGLQARFAHFSIDEGNDPYGAVVRCSTDRVEFVRIGDRTNEGVALAEIPPIVFSEAMRDVDLFVGVTSIAADANWQDGGNNRDFTAYWSAAAFGDLTASAESRREILAWMVPQLAIADRLTLDDRFLRVRGDRRTYKIHLGSGNILMEPNDQYLCIVPKQSEQANKVFLPFDSDVRLTLILSKAFLLANDKAIKDASILTQISRG